MSNTSERAGHCYLVLAPAKRLYELEVRRLTKTKPPKLGANERAIRIAIAVPSALFDTPQLEAKITVPDGAVGRPVIAAEVVDNIQAIVRQELGVSLEISVVDPEPDA